MQSLMKRDLDASEGLQFDRTSAWIASECDQSAVSTVCKNTVQSLSRFWGLLTEEHSESFPSEIQAAKMQFDAALAVFTSEPCLTPSDGRAKCATLDLFETLFPFDDCRLVELRSALVWELSRLFDMGVVLPSTQHQGLAYACLADASPT